MNSQSPYLEVPEAFYRQVFRWLWLGAAGCAILFGGAASIWPEYTKPLTAVPLIASAVAGVVIGWLGARRNKAEIVRRFASNFWLRLHTGSATDLNEIDVFEQIVPDSKDRRRVYRLRTGTGEVNVLHVERFIELLVSGAMKEMDRATEHSLAVAFQRTCGELRPELVPLLDKTFRELVKDDLNGNIITIISRVGAGIVRDLGASLEPVVESEEPFMLEMMTPTTATKKRARK